MRTSFNNLIKVIATGCIVLILLSILLFWFRMILQSHESHLLSGRAREVVIEPSGLVPDELENDTNIINHSSIRAYIKRSPSNLGINLIDDSVIQVEVGDSTLIFEADYDSIIAQSYKQPSNIAIYIIDYINNKHAYMYFDQGIGKIVYFEPFSETLLDNNIQENTVPLYAGPEGISKIPDKKLGKFYSPVFRINDSMGIMLYDNKLRRFYDINFDKKTVVEGPQLLKGDIHKPFQVGTPSLSDNMYIEIYHNMDILYSAWFYPSKKTKNVVSRIIKEVDDSKYSLVLDETGRIDLLDREKLEFVGTAGYLPAPDTVHRIKRNIQPKDLLAYYISLLVLDIDNEYRGMFAAALNREGTDLALSVFDANGIEIKKKHSAIGKSTGDISWDSTLSISKYLLENLQPPILSLASYFTADSFEAASGHRALFILPNSFIAMKGRDIEGSFAERFIYALLIILTSIILSIFLVWRVNKDAVIVGLSKDERLLWIIGTFAFGLVGYITYRLTRPRETLVTCQNCGKPRRPDMDRCHRCNSKWHVPELTPPLWRVVG